MQTLLSQAIVVKMVLNEYFYCILIHLLLILSGDVVSNPGPIELKQVCLYSMLIFEALGIN